MICGNKLEAESSFQQTKSLLESLGFIVNNEKSQSKAVQRIEFLGFTIDSAAMVISLPLKKVKNIKMSCRQLLRDKVTTIHKLAQVTGTLVATNLAVLPAPLHYRGL